ncbi:hypothetical protein C0992_009284 [Termitomyces sp. T32_za158]|nr:hypothetical protein C0992_009284 [Termitomyces sp. T32_za158]
MEDSVFERASMRRASFVGVVAGKAFGEYDLKISDRSRAVVAVGRLGVDGPSSSLSVRSSGSTDVLRRFLSSKLDSPDCLLFTDPLLLYVRALYWLVDIVVE